MSALPDKITDPLPAAITAKLPVVEDGEYSILFDTAKFEQAYRVARLFSASKFVPEAYQGNPENCFVALQMATRLRIDPMMFMQKTYIVHNKPGMEATLVIALINARGPFTGPIQWRVSGEGMKRTCTAYATHKVTGEVCEAECSMEMAKAEGWLDKSGSKWKTIPDLMLRYRSASFLGRLYAPECLMGIMTVDELDDVTPAGEIDVTPRTAPTSRSATARLREVATKPVGVEGRAIDTSTGEITGVGVDLKDSNGTIDPGAPGPKPAPEQDAGPSMEDAIAAIKRGDYDEARDIGRSLGKSDVIEGMINNREMGDQMEQQRPVRGPQRRPSGGSLE